MSFTEFTYQLVQGYDFLHLYRTQECTLQMGGSDQWGNITTGTELIRRIDQGKGFALTCPLITKADGTKFGKTATGNIWLDPDKTSPYKFYQYWINTSDEDAEKFIKIFTFLSQNEISDLVNIHKEQPHLRQLQSKLADEITASVHSKKALDKAKEASQVLFGKSTEEDLAKLDEATFLDVFEGVPLKELSKEILNTKFDMIAALSAETEFLNSNGEARRALKENSISVNKSKVGLDYTLTEKDLINGKYVLINKGKKNTYLIKFN
jgi:tyrosyl-tRNA synthetase